VNAAYQGILGLLLVVHPAAAGAIYHLAALSPVSAALCRIVGGLMAGNALLLAAYAIDPAANPWLAPLLLAGCALNVAADAAACGAGEIGWGQVAGSLVFQIALGAALGAAMLHARPARGGKSERREDRGV